MIRRIGELRNIQAICHQDTDGAVIGARYSTTRVGRALFARYVTLHAVSAVIGAVFVFLNKCKKTMCGCLVFATHNACVLGAYNL